MKDTQFFEEALGLSKPSTVKEVRMDVRGRTVDVMIECLDKTVWGNEAGERAHKNRQSARAEPKSRWTTYFECFAITDLLAARSVSEACEVLRIDWSRAQKIMDRAVERGLSQRSTQGIERVGLDKESFGRGQDYISILNDLDQSRILGGGAGQ